MKSLILIAGIILFAAAAQFAQIPNPGFENWTSGNPDGWVTTNFSILGINITSTNTSNSGSSAAKLEVILSNQGEVYPPILSASNIAVSQSYGSLRGYYQLNQLNADDYVGITVALLKQNSTVAGGAVKIKTPASSYTLFEIPITNFTNDIPDKAYISIIVASDAEKPTVGSFALLDDLTFGATVGINDRTNGTPAEFYLGQNFPNPFNPSTTIKYSTPQTQFVSIKIFNILGKEIASLVNEEKKPGNYTINFDGSNYPSGIYLYRIQAGSFIDTKKLILIK